VSDIIIDVNNVSKSFGGVKANTNVSMQVERGGITGLIGPNGSGKTTLFNSIVGYHPIDGGSIKFEGEEIFRPFRCRKLLAAACCAPFSKPVSTAR
jgi:branched-chain amino acid transport system ATP-binding protein